MKNYWLELAEQDECDAGIKIAKFVNGQIDNLEEFMGPWQLYSEGKEIREGYCRILAPDRLDKLDPETFRMVGITGDVLLAQGRYADGRIARFFMRKIVRETSRVEWVFGIIPK